MLTKKYQRLDAQLSGALYQYYCFEKFKFIDKIKLCCNNGCTYDYNEGCIKGNQIFFQ